MSAGMVTRLLDYFDEVPQTFGWQRANWTVGLLAVQLAEEFGVGVSTGTVYRALRGAGYRRGRPRPGLHIPVRGRRERLLEIRCRVAAASREEEVLYWNKANVHLNPKIGAAWPKRGQQPVVLTPARTSNATCSRRSMSALVALLPGSSPTRRRGRSSNS